MKRDFPFFYSGSNPEKFRLFLIAETEEARIRACVFTKEVLEEMLNSSKKSGMIKKYEVQIVDLANQPSPVHSDFWRGMNNQNREVFVPIFHNSDGYLDLPQIAFDDHVLGIFSLTQQSYDKVINSSKKRCYDIVRIE